MSLPVKPPLPDAGLLSCMETRSLQLAAALTRARVSLLICSVLRKSAFAVAPGQLSVLRAYAIRRKLQPNYSAAPDGANLERLLSAVVLKPGA